MAMIDWENDDISYNDILDAFLSEIKEKIPAETLNEINDTLLKIMYSTNPEDVNLMSIIKLDELNINNEKLLKLWNLCGKNASSFKKTLGYITGTYLTRCFTADEVIANLDLSKPFEFIGKDDKLSNFHIISRMLSRGIITPGEYDQIIYSLRTNLVNKYNALIDKEHLNLKKLEIPEIINKEADMNLDDTTIVDPKRLYFGKTETRLENTEGGLNFTSKTLDLYEMQKDRFTISGKILCPLKHIPSGKVVLIDEDRVLYEEVLVKTQNLTFAPNKSVTALSVFPLKDIIKDAEKRCLDNQIINRYHELIADNYINVLVCKEILPELNELYNTLYDEQKDIKIRQ